MTGKLFACLGMVFLIAACAEDDGSADTGDPNNNEDLTNSTSLETTGGETYRVGFDQQSSVNQDPFVEKTDAQGNRSWRINYETTGVDGRSILVAFINRRHVAAGAFDNVFTNNYGRGGGPVVSILARLNPANGYIEKGTFIGARLTNGNTNTLRITSLGFKNGNVVFQATAAAWPPGPGPSYQRMPNITDADRVNGSFELYYEITEDLSEVKVARLR